MRIAKSSHIDIHISHVSLHTIQILEKENSIDFIL